MGKRTLRTLHYELVAGIIKLRMDWLRRNFPLTSTLRGDDYVGGRIFQLEQVAIDFADEFEIRAESFDRRRFLISCGLEEGK